MNSKDEKIETEITKLRVECQKCHHKTFISATEDKKLCYWCGNMITNNSKLHFMYKIRKMRREENEKNEKED